MKQAAPEGTDPEQAATGGRRAARKAETRAHLVRTAQQLFDEHGFEAVTTSAIAAAASVSVQTLFNHFASKEELFFDGRAPSVDGPAAAVRSRGPYEAPLTALGQHLTGFVRDRVRFEASAGGRRYTSAVASSPTLSAGERELVHEAEKRLQDALEAAARHRGIAGLCCASGDTAFAAAVVSATWLGAARVLITSQRSDTTGGEPSPTIAEDAERVFARLASGWALTPLAR